MYKRKKDSGTIVFTACVIVYLLKNSWYGVVGLYFLFSNPYAVIGVCVIGCIFVIGLYIKSKPKQASRSNENTIQIPCPKCKHPLISTIFNSPDCTPIFKCGTDNCHHVCRSNGTKLTCLKCGSDVGLIDSVFVCSRHKQHRMTIRDFAKHKGVPLCGTCGAGLMSSGFCLKDEERIWMCKMANCDYVCRIDSSEIECPNCRASVRYREGKFFCSGQRQHSIGKKALLLD
jgi:hypothetical protein